MVLSFLVFYPYPRRRALHKGYTPSLLSDTIWKAGFLYDRRDMRTAVKVREEPR